MPANSSLKSERRSSNRARLEPIFCNKYVDGLPYLAKIVDVSEEGLLLRTTIEPEKYAECFSIELQVPGNPTTLWLWARTVRRTNGEHAVRLIGTELFDRASLAQLVRWRAAH